jgi:hypothetical protein
VTTARVEIRTRRWLFYPLLWFVAQPLVYMGADYNAVAATLVRCCVRLRVIA